MYAVTIDKRRHRGLLDVVVGVGPEETTAFDQTIKAAALKARGGAAHFDMLVDLDQSPLMTQAMSADSMALFAWFIANGLRRSANITGRALARLQIQRVTADDRFRAFASRDDAVAWLGQPD